MAYPNFAAAGITAEGTFDPAELFAGESDIVTDRGTVGASSIAALQVICRGSDLKLVPWVATAGKASKAGTFSAVGTAADTITVNGVVFTLTASPVAVTDVLIGGTATATAVSFAAAVNADTENTHTTAEQAGAVVTIYAEEPGSAGNSIAISEASTSFSFAGGATALSGGIAESESRPIGIAACAATTGEGLPYFTGGAFNHAILVWPADITTLDQRKAAFDRTNIQISSLLGSSGNMVFT